MQRSVLGRVISAQLRWALCRNVPLGKGHRDYLVWNVCVQARSDELKATRRIEDCLNWVH